MTDALTRTTAPAVEDDDALTVPRWLAPVTLFFAIVGLAVAAYLTYEHFSGKNAPLGCSTGGTIDCGAVTTSPESKFLGMPVALLGLVYFVLAVPFLTPMAWRSRHFFWRYGRLAGAVGGLGFVFWLLYAELIKVKHICEYCSSVHAITLILFVLIVYGTIVTAPPLAYDDLDDDLDDLDEHDLEPDGA